MNNVVTLPKKKPEILSNFKEYCCGEIIYFLVWPFVHKGILVGYKSDSSINLATNPVVENLMME